ncbi:hypothetical protein X740_04715 [Mesorhizobium sp. LNHC221B00]|nr:hypothetical protein X740_04715 [Mesorhizobium sp. LNHC221B00]
MLTMISSGPLPGQEGTGLRVGAQAGGDWQLHGQF